MHLHFLGRSIVVLNSVEAANDLLEKRSANYSDRPIFHLFNYLGWPEGFSITHIQYGRQFQKHRRILQDYLNKSKSVSYRPIQLRETGALLQNLVSDDTKRDDIIRRFSTTIIMRLVYGHQITSEEDPYLAIAERVGYAISNIGSPGSTPVDFFPILKHFPAWFPGAYYAGFARDNRSAILNLHEYPFKEVERLMAEGKANPSFLAYHLEALHRDGPDCPNTVEDIKGTAGVMYCAASDTTWSSLSIFFLAMVLYPECQVRAQKEIEAVIGTERLPAFDDRGSLPYVESVLQETLRWNHAVPMGVPHRSMEDDVYRGMFIPKGSLIIANTRGMTLDESVYSEPFKFDPVRYLPRPEGRGEPYPSGPFGFGRRICPGRHVADGSMWIAIASVLATLSVLKALDESGKEITPQVAFTSGITSHPVPYRCRILPRNERSRALIVQADITDVY